MSEFIYIVIELYVRLGVLLLISMLLFVVSMAFYFSCERDPSLLGCILPFAFYRSKYIDNVKKWFNCQSYDEVGRKVRYRVIRQVRDQVEDRVWVQVEDRVWSQIRDQVKDQTNERY